MEKIYKKPIRMVKGQPRNINPMDYYRAIGLYHKLGKTETIEYKGNIRKNRGLTKSIDDVPSKMKKIIYEISDTLKKDVYLFGSLMIGTWGDSPDIDLVIRKDIDYDMDDYDTLLIISEKYNIKIDIFRHEDCSELIKIKYENRS